MSTTADSAPVIPAPTMGEAARAGGEPPRVSVIMPCYNAAATILGAIASVQAQTFDDWELIVVDDGSADDSAERVAAVRDPRIVLARQRNGGSAAARNRGLREARGEFIAFLDSDDSWDPTFLARMVDALAPRADAVLAYCGWQNLGITGGRGAPFVPPDYDGLDRAETLLGGCRWPIHGALVRRQAIERAGGFDDRLQAAVDYDLWLRVSDQGALVRVPAVLAFYHHHGGEQITKNGLRVALNHWRAQRKYLDQHPEVIERLGARRVRELVVGELLRRGYAAYWARDLPAARTLFRAVMRRGYGRLRDWRYMLPALLPLSWHQGLLRLRDRRES